MACITLEMNGAEVPLITGLDAADCFARFGLCFAACASDHVAGKYDDTKRIRANVWWRAARALQE